MANKLDPMNLKRIISLHLNGHSNRKIASTLDISRNTVNAYIQLFIASEYSLEQLLSFDVTQLSEIFSSCSTINAQRLKELMLYFEKIKKASNHPGFTFLYPRKRFGYKTPNEILAENLDNLESVAFIS